MKYDHENYKYDNLETQKYDNFPEAWRGRIFYSPRFHYSLNFAGACHCVTLCDQT